MANDVLSILDEKEKADLEKQMAEVRNRMLLNKKKQMAKEAGEIAYKDPEGGFVWKNAEEVMGDPNYSAAVDDGKGGFKRISVEEAVTDKIPPFDYTQLRQDSGDAGSRARGEIDPAIADKLNSVNIVDGEWYNVDDKGESWHLGEGEKEAMELMRSGAKPGLGVMSARRIALQRAKEGAEALPTDEYKIPLPTLDNKRPSMLSKMDNDEDDEEMLKMQARTSR